jgi:putative ABC transport system ATP-binding protein
MNLLLEISGLQKSYRAPDGSTQVVIDVPQFSLGAQEQVALAGESGSGKTTLLHLVAGILRPDAGEIRFDGENVAAYSEARRDAHRARNIGYVFQTFQLLEGLTALENVALGMAFGARPDPALAASLLNELGLGDRLHHEPRRLSVGQQQRVALARALANRPRLVLADEPTGSLDARRAAEALELLRRACASHGAALLLVSHDPGVLREFDRVEELARLNRAAAGASA